MPNPTDHEPRATWGFITDVLDVFEKHGYRKSDDEHTGRVIGYLPDLARIYSGDQDQLEHGPGVLLPGGGWISGPSSAPAAAPHDPVLPGLGGVRCMVCGHVHPDGDAA